MGLFEYKFADSHFSPEYGVFCVFALFMLFYIAFGGGLLVFHSYLLIMNVTSRELMSRNKWHYLRNVNDNPFYSGLLRNLYYAVAV